MVWPALVGTGEALAGATAFVVGAGIAKLKQMVEAKPNVFSTSPAMNQSAVILEAKRTRTNSSSSSSKPSSKTNSSNSAKPSLQEIKPEENKPQKLRDSKGRYVSDPNNPKSDKKYTDADRRKDWKKLAEDPDSPLTPEQREEIKKRGWRGPQQVNEFGELETMELSHEPIPLRDGGTRVVPRWPADHAEVDEHRKLKKRN